MTLYATAIDPEEKPNAWGYANAAGFWISPVNNQWSIDAADQTEADEKIAALEAWFAAFDHIAAAKEETTVRLNEETAARLNALEAPAQQTMLLTSATQKLIANAGTPVNQWSQGDQSELANLQARLNAIDALAAAADVISADFHGMSEFWDIYSYDIINSTLWPS